jgi:predicted nucleic acid-binding protein
VWDEVVIKGAGRPGSSETSQADWIKVSPIANPTLTEAWKILHSLGAGEVSTILLAKQLSAKFALIDERRARTLAVKEELAVSGSIAILETGYRKNHVSDLREVYAQLLAAGIWIDQKKLNQSLASFDLSHL